MVTWRQFKILRGKRCIGKKAKQFALLEMEVIENTYSRRIKEKFKGEKGLQIEQENQKIFKDKRKREQIRLGTNAEREIEVGRIIRKSKKIAEIEVWEEDKKNRGQQREDYVEEVRLLKKENSKKYIVLKEIQDISNLIRKKENELYILANKDLLFNIEKKKQ